MLTATADLGWNFVGWSGDLVSSANPLTVPITGNTTLTATFSQNTYLLNVSVVGAGSVSRFPDQASYIYGTVVTLTATAVPGWSFTGWIGDLTSSANPLWTTITGNTNLTATFSQDHYLLDVSVAGNGLVSKLPNQASYVYGEAVTLTATADPGWTFAGWTGDTISSNNPLTLTIAANTNLTATFTQDAYLLDVSVVGSGQVSIIPNQPSYLYGEVVALTATADPSWSFSGWSGDTISSANPLTLTITSDTAIVANFFTNWVYLPLVNKFLVP